MLLMVTWACDDVAEDEGPPAVCDEAAKPKKRRKIVRKVEKYRLRSGHRRTIRLIRLESWKYFTVQGWGLRPI